MSKTLNMTNEQIRALMERAKDDHAIIAGGEVRQVCALLLEARAGLLPSGLPAEVPEGFVRCRAAVATDEQGNHCVYGFGFTDHDGEPDMGDWTDVAKESVYCRENHKGDVLVSFVTLDAPKPASPSEIVGEVSDA